MEGGAGGLERLAEVDGAVEEVAEGGFDDGEDLFHLGVRGAGRGWSCWFRHVWDVGRVRLKGYGGNEKGEKMVLGDSVMKMVRVEMATWCCESQAGAHGSLYLKAQDSCLIGRTRQSDNVSPVKHLRQRRKAEG